MNQIDNVKHISQNRYNDKMYRYHKREMTESELEHFKEEIQRWELYSFFYMRGLKTIQLRGVPSPILRQYLINLGHKDWSSFDYSLLSVSHLDDSNEFINQYRTIEHQYILYVSVYDSSLNLEWRGVQ